MTAPVRRSRDYARLAAEAHTNLNVFHALANMVEGGTLYGARPQSAAAKIVRLCRYAAAKELAAFDHAMERIHAD
jgi:hypothetical protein